LRLLRLAARPSSSIPTADSARPARLGADRLLAVLAVGQAAHPTAGHGALNTASMKSQVHIGEAPPLILLLVGAGEHLRELLGQDRLGEVRVEPCRAGPAAVLGLPVACERDQEHALAFVGRA